MNEISYFDAWHRWLNGENVSNFYLWGFQILWWGRIGKLVSFISALAVVVELIGPARLRKFGASLHGRFTTQKAAKTIAKGFQPLWASIRSIHPDNEDAFWDFLRSRIGCISSLLGVSLGIFVAYKAGFFIGFFAFLMVGWFASVVIFPLIIALLITTLMYLSLLIDVLLIEPLAWMLERESPDRIMKASSLILLVIGFHFDLLAS